MEPLKTARYQVVESTDLRSNVKSYRIYRRNHVGPPVLSDLATLEEAERKMRELEENDG